MTYTKPQSKPPAQPEPGLLPTPFDAPFHTKPFLAGELINVTTHSLTVTEWEQQQLAIEGYALAFRRQRELWVHLLGAVVIGWLAGAGFSVAAAQALAPSGTVRVFGLALTGLWGTAFAGGGIGILIAVAVGCTISWAVKGEW